MFRFHFYIGNNFKTAFLCDVIARQFVPAFCSSHVEHILPPRAWHISHFSWLCSKHAGEFSAHQLNTKPILACPEREAKNA